MPTANDSNKMAVGDLLRRYINDPSLGGKAGHTKRYVHDNLLDCDIAKIPLTDLLTSHVIEHCRQRCGAGAGPSTVNHDVSYLSSVLASAKPVYGIDYTTNPATDARPLLLQMGLIGKSKRSRRPVSDELDRLLAGLESRSEHIAAKIPFVDILNFSILSCMGVGEVCKIRWEDLDEKQKAVLVRDRKDPRKKTGNHMLVPLLGEAWDIVQRQPKTSALIFPYNSLSVTADFQRVRNSLSIEDLRFHDLRREGASRLLRQVLALKKLLRLPAVAR
ncbi:Phage integrase family protein [Izhakiella capsodis]|uniref:Phage integrase family protein n=1 Tax=Izhakiella capsodis TaxID=1367852 RepID=A0A1I4X1C0_9GAMM|nr:Phage integrase family protein [Izhakiella capsodis]